MKFKILLLSVFWHSIVYSNNSKRCFNVLYDYHALTEPIVGELTTPLLPSQRAGGGACDVTGRDPKS